MSGVFRWALIVLGVIGLDGCGWHLRGGGQSQLADQPLIIEAQMGEGDLVRRTRQSLRRLGARLAQSGEAAPVLELIAEDTSRRTIATDDDGRASAWELTYRLRFALRPASGDGGEPAQPLITARSVAAEDSYQASPQDTLAEQAQRQRLAEELRDEAVRLMLSQVATALGE